MPGDPGFRIRGPFATDRTGAVYLSWRRERSRPKSGAVSSRGSPLRVLRSVPRFRDQPWGLRSERGDWPYRVLYIPVLLPQGCGRGQHHGQGVQLREPLADPAPNPLAGYGALKTGLERAHRRSLRAFPFGGSSGAVRRRGPRSRPMTDRRGLSPTDADMTEKADLVAAR